MLRILVIDDSEEFWRLIVYFVRRQWPDAQVEWIRPVSHEKPDADFPWSDYQLLVLDHSLGLEDETGLDWLRDLASQTGFPPTVMISDAEDDEFASRYLSLGASRHLHKDNLSSKVLREVIEDALASQATPSNVGTQANKEEKKLSDTLVSVSNPATFTQDAVDDEAPSIVLPRRQRQFEPDLRVPGYKLLSRIGRGGMSTVYLAERSEDERQVILKVLFTDGQEETKALKRFMLEYKLIGWLRHPNVVEIYERAFAQDFAYIAMEYFHGGDLAQRIRRGISRPDALNYVRQIAEGLKPVHERGIVHRDLKPANILFRDKDTLAITDFGIAKELNVEYSITGHDGILGTPYYMSPEQAKESDVDPRSDLYSLGVVLFEMLAGERPYTGSNISMIVQSHLHESVPRLPQACADLQPVIDGLLAKDPDERFQTSEELLTALDWL